MKLYAQNLTNKLYYDTLYRSATPFVAVAPGRAFYLVTSAKF
jgi:catecholate siderophore receptor